MEAFFIRTLTVLFKPLPTLILLLLFLPGLAFCSTIWPSSQLPDTVDSGPDSPVQLGVKFSSDTNGVITGIRFYKSAGNTGTHVGSLWTTSGTRLANATFTNETASGWQQVDFATPVAVSANTVYIASYHTTVGYYSYNQYYFLGSSIDNTPLHALADGISGSNGVFVYGTASAFPDQSWKASNYWVDVVFDESNTVDTSPPEVTAFTVPAASTSLTVTISSFSASDNIAVSGYLVTESAIAPSATSSEWTADAPASYTFTTAGSKTLYAWAKDAAGNISVGDSAATIITLSSTTTYTIWPSSQLPDTVDSGPDSPVQLGVKFSSDTNGVITGIRFYKSAGNTGTHVGSLWTTSGTRLANATFTNETASGWQQVDFATPVAVSANTVYIASYHTTVGYYSYNQYYFLGSSIDNTPLHALADGISGSNGVFVYGTASAFPDQSWKASNYWVDVVFDESNTVDTSPPEVTAFTVPAASTSLTVTISSFSASDNIAVSGYLVTESAIAPSATSSEWTADAPASYTFTTAGSKTLYAWAKDAAGNISVGDSAATIITLSLDSDKPLLIITSTLNPFSGYYAEILRAEGFNAFVEKEITAITSTFLAAYDVIVVADAQLTESHVALLTDWVNGGGHLIAMRPDKKLADLLGLNDLDSTMSNAYLLVNNSPGPGAGIVDQTMQFHGTADLYSLNGATSLATLYSNATTAGSSPAVTLRTVGSNGGQAAAFTYDLARSVVYTRQGNPAWSNQERDRFAPIRSDDLYYGAASFDPQSDWVNLDKVDIPQADEQQRLLANLIILMNLEKKPLPRFWYFPRSLSAVVVMTGDDHGTGGTVDRFDSYLAASPPDCSVDNWECIRGTSYIYTNTPLSKAQAATYNNAGFEVTLHVSSNCADWTAESLELFYTTQLAEWRAKYGDLYAPLTNRTHCIAWSDYTTQAKVELDNGIRLDTNYYYWPQSWTNDKPGLFTGSGMPMRFADFGGNLIDVYQAATQMTDESGQTYPFTIDMLLDRAIGSEGYYGVFVVNAHTDEATSSVSDAVIGSAIARGVPVITARQLLKWLDGRNGSTFNNLSWDGNVLSFSIIAAEGANGLMAMAPTPVHQTVTEVTNNGNAVPFDMVMVKGIAYARFSAVTGAYQVTYGSDTTPPVITSNSPVNGASGISTMTNVTATFSKIMDSSTITENTIELRDHLGVAVPATLSYAVTTQTATVTPTASLANATTYSVLIRGGASGVKDLSGNAITGDYSWSFDTVSLNGPFFIWPGSTVPDVIDSGPDGAVELGVKFRSELSGSITGIRFYKAATNTGVHIGNLWDASGKLLATTTFTNETASGWQQAMFSIPVQINANTVYVASYQTGVGHYSINSNFFNSQGVDSPPLYALANGVSGGNGVFAYGADSKFPDGDWNSSNYWVDVVFTASAPLLPIQTLQTQQPAEALPVTLLSIELKPDNQRIAIGSSLQFTAIGTFSNGSKQDLTKQVAWVSSNINRVEVSSTGLVTAFTPGTTTITATLNNISGSTKLTSTAGNAGISSGQPLLAKR